MNKQLYNKTGTLSRFILRRDRIRIPLWLISLSLITFVVANAFTNLYATGQDRQAIAETMNNPAMSAMVGQGYGLDNYTNGAMMAHQMLLFTGLAVRSEERRVGKEGRARWWRADERRQQQWGGGEGE